MPPFPRGQNESARAAPPPAPAGPPLGHPNGPGPAPIKRVLCWTINRPREMRDLLNMGVHGILTDRPDVLRREADALLGKAVAKAAERTART